MPEFNVNLILFIILIIRSDNTFNSTVKNRELAKLEIALACGKKTYDKRESLKLKD